MPSGHVQRQLYLFITNSMFIKPKVKRRQACSIHVALIIGSFSEIKMTEEMEKKIEF